MAEETKESDAFFDHFSREDKPTGIGMRLVKALARRIFNYMQAGPGASILEIGPGRGDFADICLREGMDYSAIEANRQMAESLEERGATVISAMVPPLPALEREFDVVVMINVMEHMNSMADALQITQQIRRVLKPGGELIFCEHGAAPDPGVRRWQDRIDPIWKRVFGGCHLNRAIPELIEQEGFRIERMDTMYVPGWRPASFNYWGSAVPV